ncbi:hypothetical protein PILCRDRAFT_12223 [Piloderma croceum F 1598]|uniref:Uncharacterized protein n=1 Tax=Piloderma croceum (strain F 1598) TaxID=765440 RepID=A0A0C3FBK2_PILCF|nr:hypothetical protein PILCRDRAFT_12223 [Piloderma croceum F 1598]
MANPDLSHQHQPMSAQLRHVSSHSFRDRSVSARPLSGSARLGSSSIPSSPTSVHSSSSAIFERDIEPISCSPPISHNHTQNPHRTPRSKQTEQLDQNVPSVLDSAATILASSPSTLEDDRIGVVAPASSSAIIAPVGVGNRRSSGFTSPIGSFASRSPSPTMGKRTTVLLSTPSPPLSNSPPPTAAARANLSIQTTAMTMASTPNASTPSIVTPTSAYYSAAESGSGGSSTTTLEHHPPTSFSLPWSNPQPLTNTHFSHPPSPTTTTTTTTIPPVNASKRISFISYTDLLASTPTSFHLLSSLTTAASTSEPPPHIPIVSGLITQTQTQTQHTSQHHGHYYTPPSLSHSPRRGGSGSLVGGGVGERDSGIFDDLGGEWEKEGMGGGLEERLEALLGGVAGGMLTPVR